MPIFKKLFFLSVLLLGISLLFWGVYRLAFSNSNNAPAKTTGNNLPKPAPAAPAKQTNEKISALTDEAVLAPTFSADKSAIQYYSKTTGQVFQIDQNGNSKKTISNQNVSGLAAVLWSPDKNSVISEIKSGSGEMNFFLYSYISKSAVSLKKNLDTVVWNPTGEKIFYKYYDPKSQVRTLNISDSNGSNWTKLADLSYKDISVAPIPQSASVSFWNTGDAYAQTDFESVPVIGGDKKVIYKDKFGTDYLWNDSGSKILASSTDSKGGYKMQLATMNYNGGEYNNLDIPTFVSKCVWSRDDKTVFYALPGGIPDNSVLPNDYKAGKFNTTDTFWKVNITTGEKTRLAELTDIKSSYDADKMFLNEDESALFFVNKIDGKLYKINL
jgi:hypothetical protein